MKYSFRDHPLNLGDGKVLFYAELYNCRSELWGESGRACLNYKGNTLPKYKGSNDLSNRMLEQEQCELNQNKLKLQIKRFLLLNVFSSMKAFF